MHNRMSIKRITAMAIEGLVHAFRIGRLIFFKCSTDMTFYQYSNNQYIFKPAYVVDLIHVH